MTQTLLESRPAAYRGPELIDTRRGDTLPAQQSPGRFAPLDALLHQQQESERTRTFIAEGDPKTAAPGSPLLKVPGLRGLESVRVGMTPIPLTEERLHATRVEHVKERVIEPLIRLERLPDGVPVLQRSVLSNDGIWQPGVTVYVTGEWADDNELWPSERALIYGEDAVQPGIVQAAEQSAPRRGRPPKGA